MHAKTLFSLHYLENRLPDHPEWAQDPRPAFAAVRALWQKARQFGGAWNEAQTEDEFVRPLLEILGWAYIVQPKAQRHGRVTRPDYALFADEAARDAAYPFQGQDDPFYSRALAIAEAKYWGRPLSQKDASGRNTWKAEGNPSHQMVSYLVGTRVPWGILTNGVTWRLYSREVSSTASEFYEVDLGLIFDFLPPDGQPTPAQLDQFRRWWLFFRRDAFLPDVHGRSFVQRVHEGSATYARQISDKLKELVFDQVMPEIAGGFVAYRRQCLGIYEEDDESLREIYQASLSLLYKLLFILYAEARALLPMDNPGYREQSLTALAQWAAERLDKGLPLSDALHATARYDALLALFHRIDRGDPSLSIPRYNGGLFDPASPENQFLERHRLSDRTVARAVDTLVRDAGQPVDYAYIDVRNLGAIYEGLLENRLVLRPDRSSETCQVLLVNDKGERKATGSYYTPDYIVEYIVRHTLDPILDEREAVFRAAMSRCADLRRKLARTSNTTTVRRLRGELDEAERDAREAFLGIKVLDPAMGSGHFLVNAVDHLTDEIIRRMQAYHDEHPDVPWAWNPIQQLTERVRAEILAEMARQGIALDPARLDDTALLTRLVMKRCIYGVDLNRMAVELAKLSLWLHSFTVGAPLSFLDHHLRWGNSLIGADVRTVERAIRIGESGQLTLFAGPFAGLLDLTGLMVEVVERADATLADVHASAEVYERFQRELTPYKQVLDLWVSQHFGNREAYEFLTLYGGDVLPVLKGERETGEKYQAAIARTRDLWRAKRFFHWDLEFPEVFVDLRRRDWAENPGFDAVIGNPPYGFVSDKLAQAALSKQYVAVSSHDLYIAFFERGLQVLRCQGTLSYIAPTSWQTGIAHQDFRSYALRTCHIAQIVNLPYDVFADAYIDTGIYVLRKERDFSTTSEFLDRPVKVYEFGKRENSAQKMASDLNYWRISSGDWLEDEQLRFVIDRRVLQLRKALKRLRTVTLGEITDSARGILAGESDLSDRQTSSDWKPYFEGDVYRYQLLWETSRWVRYRPDLPEAPSSYDYFTGPRLLVRRLISRQARMMATYAVEEFVNKKDLYNVLVTEKNYSEFALLALLNSCLHSYLYIAQSAMATRDDFPQVTLADLRKLPIRRIAFTTPDEERERWATLPLPLPPPLSTCGEGGGQQEGEVTYAAFLQSPIGRWLDERLSPIHVPDPDKVRQHNANPLNRDWQLPETGPVEQADVVHDLLARLAEQMIAMNKEKQAEVKGFLAWLEREIGAPLDSLTGKSRLHNYLGDYQKGEAHLSLEELLDILRRNARRLRVNLSARRFQEQLAQEYQASLDKLLPLKARLAATDRLIDLIVYRLYGLTEEEVAVVEGRSNGGGKCT